MIIKDSEKEIEFSNSLWPVAEPLFSKWGMEPTSDNIISVKDVHDISPELSAWGIPWKWR